MSFSAAVITVSDKGVAGLREDTSGPNLVKLLEGEGYTVTRTALVPDEYDRIREALLACCREDIALILTTGGTGFAPRDITPEVTRSVLERETPGLPEAMRAESMKITPRGCLSRSAAGIRGRSLIVNLPGSRKAAEENIRAVLDPIRHGLETLRGESTDCAAPEGKVLAVCISEKKGEQKHPVKEIHLIPDHGILGDAHAGNWHRQVSLLGTESVEKVQQKIGYRLQPGDFAENVLTKGICLYTLPVGAKLLLGTALCEVTQIGKECHKGCAIRQKAGDCVMPREGIFVKVLKEGTARAGDLIRVI